MSEELRQNLERGFSSRPGPLATENAALRELIRQIQAAHDTEETGNDLVVVCRDAHLAQLREARREIKENEAL